MYGSQSVDLSKASTPHLIVRAVNAARQEIVSGDFESNIEKIYECVSKNLSCHRSHPHVAALFDTLDQKSLGSGELLNLTLEQNPSFILGFFNVPYNPNTFFECANLELVSIPDEVLQIAPESMAVPVIVKECTDGFRDPLAVAVFGENYIQSNLNAHHKAYYFIDKFVARFQQFTLPTIRQFWDEEMFSEIAKADEATLYQTAAIWVWMHEYFHRKGPLPIPEYLTEKSTRNGGGAEELRVDMLSILALQNIKDVKDIYLLTIQYILAERLIRYPLQACPEKNYDARSSVALYSYLRRHGVLVHKHGKIKFCGGYSNLYSALMSLSVKISSLELRLLDTPEIDKRKILSTVLPQIASNENKWEIPNIYLEAQDHFSRQEQEFTSETGVLVEDY